MPTQSERLQIMLGAISAMREAGYTREDVQDLVAQTWHHLEGLSSTPYAFGNCSHCGRVIIAWSAYQWSILVREPCSRCGQPW